MAVTEMPIEWEGGVVSAILEGDPGPMAILLAHGAGAGQDHPWMTTMRRLLSAGAPTMTFNYRYTEGGRRSPDRIETSLAVHRAAADRLAAMTDRVVLAGKSMGGRVASHMAGDGGWPAAGMVYFGYPLVPLGRAEPRDTAHLDRISAPQLFFAGANDRMGPSDLLAPVVERLSRARLEIVEAADHSFRVPKRTGRSQDEVLATIAAATIDWLPR